MIFEFVAFYGIIILVLFCFAEFRTKPEVGIVASVLLLTFSLWIIVDGIQIQTGQDINITETAQADGTLSGILNGTRSGSENVTYSGTYNETYDETKQLTEAVTRNETVVNRWEDIPDTPYMNYTEVLGIGLTLLSVYLVFNYIFWLFRLGKR